VIRILIVDDHALFRHGLRQIFLAEDDLETVAEADNGTDALNIMRDNEVDVVVLDISMPGRNGVECLKDIRRLHPDTAVIVLSMHRRDHYAVRVLKAGAAGYLTKNSAPDELVKAIRKAHAGGKYITADVADLLALYLERQDDDDPHKLLTDREFQVLVMLGSGRAVNDIASELNLSSKTVSTYKARILEKTGLTSNTDIVHYCLDHDLIGPNVVPPELL